jgi:esterase/lipase superfamily enzyme
MTAPMLQHFERPFPVSVRGVVTDDLGDLVQGAAVNLLFGGQPVGRAESSIDGGFLMTDLQLKQGIHTIRTSKPGYSTSDETLVVTESMADTTQIVLVRLNPTGWEDPSLEPIRPKLYSVQHTERRSSQQKYAVVEVFFATDRKFQNVRNVYKRFGPERSDDGRIALGVAHVSIPEGHRLGQMESPVFGLRILEDPERHVVLLDLATESETPFYEKVSKAIERSAEHDAFIFIHGYNVTFAEAVRRTAQIAFDLNFKGAPVCYSWPSQGRFSKYMADEATIEWTIPHLDEIARKLGQMGNVATLHFIGHSMGNRALTHVLAGASANKLAQFIRRVRQVILAAPDIDAGVFKQMAGAVASAAQRTTLYASSADIALEASQQFHAYARAGEAGENILVLAGIDTIDASLVPSGFLGHSYYGGRTALGDIYELLKHGAPPPRFGLKPMAKGERTYWLIQA